MCAYIIICIYVHIDSHLGEKQCILSGSINGLINNNVQQQKQLQKPKQLITTKDLFLRLKETVIANLQGVQVPVDSQYLVFDGTTAPHNSQILLLVIVGTFPLSYYGYNIRNDNDMIRFIFSRL